MSTILEALRERERDDPAGPGTRRAERPWRGWRSAAASALAGAAAGLLVMRWSPNPPDPRQVEAPADLPRPPVAVQPAAQATPLAALAPVDEPPRARVRRWQPAIPSPAPAPTPATVETAVAPRAQPSASGETPPRSPGQSGLRLESIAYATAAGERSVTLAIDGAPPVVLRQGESASGIEVQLILPDAVYVRNGTDVFALGAVR